MKILILAGNTLRSKAYAQIISKNINKEDEIVGLFYGFEQKECPSVDIDRETEKYLKKYNFFIPDFSIELEDIFRGNNWDFIKIDTIDVNAEILIAEINKIRPDLVVFSGYGGGILREEHFLLKTPYLHMHPGYLPEERGSTTIYYSILNERQCSVTAFFMNSSIDAGGIILRRSYDIPQKGINIDQWYDNCIRADCFKYAIKLLKEKNVDSSESDNKNADEYYVIHPLLKHIAILSLK